MTAADPLHVLADARDRPHLLDPAIDLGGWLAEQEQPAWRAAAIRRWLFGGRADSFAAMTDLPQGLRERLAEHFRIWTTSIAAHQRSVDGTEKLLLEFAYGQRV